VGEIRFLETTEEVREKLDEMALACILKLKDDNVSNERQRQLLKNGDVHGTILWPSSSAVANYLLGDDDDDDSNNSADWSQTRIVELGAGNGFLSIAAALAGARQVTATDFEPLPLRMAEYAAQQFHQINIETQLLDICDYQNTPLPIANSDSDNDNNEDVIVVASDVNYEPDTGVALAYRTAEALTKGCRVVIGDSPERPGRPYFWNTLKKLGITNTTQEEELPVIHQSKGVTLEFGEEIELPVTIIDLQPMEKKQ